MLACKGIFAKPSRTQRAQSARRRTPKGLRSKTFCVYYTMKQKCLLARAFLRSRQERSVRKAHGGERLKGLRSKTFCVYYTISGKKHKTDPGFRGKKERDLSLQDRSPIPKKIPLRSIPDRHKEVFSPHVRVVSKCALNKSRLRTKSVCFFVFNRYNEDVRFAH